MKKDIIYIDVEDDITAIIEKVKAADSKIVALVPPKRIGVLQSAVNLKLLQKSASLAGKQIVLISSDHSLVNLAAMVRLPLARNLQSKPEIPILQESQVSEEDDIINGENMAVGDLAAIAATSAVKTSVSDQISNKIDLGTID